MNKKSSGIWGICLRRLNSILALQAALFVMLVLLTAVAQVSAASSGCPSNDGHVARAMFTTAIEDREPVNRVLILDDKYKLVYFFTDLRNLQGHEIIHRWEHDGKVVSEKSFSVKGPRWRVYSLQHLNDDLLGRWTVVVSEKNGCPLKAVVFQYVKSDPNSGGSAILNPK